VAIELSEITSVGSFKDKISRICSSRTPCLLVSQALKGQGRAEGESTFAGPERGSSGSFLVQSEWGQERRVGRGLGYDAFVSRRSDRPGFRKAGALIRRCVRAPRRGTPPMVPLAAAGCDFQAPEPLNHCRAPVQTPPAYSHTRRAIASQSPAVQAPDAAVQLGGKFCFCQIFTENVVFR
jgi:hypothetical protein